MNLTGPCLLIFIAMGLNILPSEPSIQCTVVQVKKVVTLERVGTFPKRYQTISNDPSTSRLFVAGVELQSVDPQTIAKTSQSETIAIPIGKSQMKLELTGTPISRHGHLKFNGKPLAKITCH